MTPEKLPGAMVSVSSPAASACSGEKWISPGACPSGMLFGFVIMVVGFTARCAGPGQERQCGDGRQHEKTFHNESAYGVDSRSCGLNLFENRESGDVRGPAGSVGNAEFVRRRRRPQRIVAGEQYERNPYSKGSIEPFGRRCVVGRNDRQRGDGDCDQLLPDGLLCGFLGQRRPGIERTGGFVGGIARCLSGALLPLWPLRNRYGPS